ALTRAARLAGSDLTDVVLLGDEDPRQPEALLELRRERLHAERLGRPVRAEEEVDPALAGVELRVHAAFAGEVGVGAVLAGLFDHARVPGAAGGDRDALARRRVLPRLDGDADDVTKAIGELRECAVMPADDRGQAAVVREEALVYGDAERRREQIGVPESGRAVERRVGAVQRDAVVLQSIELLRRELEVDARPGAMVDDEEIGV